MMPPTSKQRLILAIFFFAATACGQLPQNNWQNQNQQYGGSQENECCEDYCYAIDEEPYLNFATKTAYDNLNRRSGSQHIVPECTPVQFWSINRYGTRLPAADKIEKFRNLRKLQGEISRNYEQKRSYPDKGRLCTQDYDLFRRWSWNDSITEDMAKTLTRQGVEELRLLARRYKAKYSQIFQGAYDERSYHFQYTNTERVQASYQAYIEGLFGSEAYKVHANVINDDRLIRPEENCKTWTEQFGDNTDMLRDYNRFLQNPEYTQMVRDVFRRLGFTYTLNETIINDIYDMCRYEKAWNIQQRSAWCIAFTKNQLKLLEYAEDLKYYYKAGYGNPIAEKIGCSSVKDFYERFEKTVNGNSDGNKATFFFTNSLSLQSMITAMGIAKDYNPLTADNYQQQTRRNWRTSVIDPFAGNLAAILYQCRGNEKHKVMFFLNEIPVEFPECSVGLCDWSMVQSKFHELVENCNVEEFCNGNSASTRYLNYPVSIFAAVLMIYFRY